MNSPARVLAIVGQTGTGKTELACELARRIGGEVIGADSMQVYRRLDIGTAKPSRALREEIPHHAIDLVEPDDPMSAGRYSAYARRAALDIQRRDKCPILCGGTGLYARAFAGGLVEGVASTPSLRTELESRPTVALRQELEQRDPVAAERIASGDRVRMVRALEIASLGGARPSELRTLHGFGDRPFRMIWLGLRMEREPLWDLLRTRVEQMFQGGLVEEVRELRRTGFSPTLRALNSIGYRQAGQVIDGEIDEASAREAAWIATRRYAKRQLTWFRAEPELQWLDAARPAEILDEALERFEAAATG